MTSGRVGYDRDRVSALHRRLRLAIGALSDCRSVDPAARPVLDAVHRLGRVLEDHWLPVVLAIERHDPLAASDHDSPITADGGAAIDGSELDLRRAWTSRWLLTEAGRFASLSDDELVGALEALERQWPLPDGDLDLGAALDDPHVAALGREVAWRIRTDPGVAATLIDAAGGLDALAFIATRFDVPTAFVTDLLVRRFSTPLDAPIGVDRSDFRRRMTDSLLAAASTSSDACARLVADAWVRGALATDRRLDAETVATVVGNGVIASDEPLARLLDFGNWARRGPFPPGVARGLSIGVAAVARDVARGLDDGNVVAGATIRTTDGGERLAHWDDLADVVAAMVSDETALVNLVGVVHDLLDVEIAAEAESAVRRDLDGPEIVIELGQGLVGAAELARLVLVDGVRLDRERRLELASAHRERARLGSSALKALVERLPVTREATALVSFVTTLAVPQVTGERSATDTAPEAAAAELDGVATELFLARLATDDVLWSRVFPDLSESGDELLRHIARTPRGAPSSEVVMERIRTALGAVGEIESRSGGLRDEISSIETVLRTFVGASNLDARVVD